ncbi:SRPBCC family protein [Brevundimonas diminuta]|uniref:SRPBCC family protein n=1 Tax=Brevundimonas diminuta TaxID=293 RepID=UPI0020969473|nr:SRPBCC family protein [Brevundimonas diminuta]MCO8018609.1 SRPBCC family protein [Brevundimonas diminuta]MCO8020540.1 SRPBCC family protein [Brevundimonas diminuta]
MTDRPISTDADVDSSAFRDSDLHEGRHAADSLRAILIRRPRSALYGYWRDLLNLPVFSETVKSVEVLDATHSRWVVEGPGGKDVALTSVITEDLADRRIAWTSTEGSDVDHEGWIEFRDHPFGRGTEVRLFISYDPPGGAVGKAIAKVMQREPRLQARRELRRFKQLMETGEISTSRAPDAAPRGSRRL